MKTKTCPGCQKDLPPDEFRRGAESTSRARDPLCRDCRDALDSAKRDGEDQGTDESTPPAGEPGRVRLIVLLGNALREGGLRGPDVVYGTEKKRGKEEGD